MTGKDAPNLFSGMSERIQYSNTFENRHIRYSTILLDLFQNSKYNRKNCLWNNFMRIKDNIYCN